MKEKYEASFSMLTMSIASSAAMAMGLTPDPATGKTEVDKGLARFNIDLLAVLQEKSKGNLTTEEKGFLETVLSDLHMTFVTW
jgi:hypothetical protein